MDSQPPPQPTKDSLFASLPPDQRPQERLEAFGAGALSDTELVALLLRSGTRELDVLQLSQRIIRESGSLAGLLRWSAEDFQKLPGVGRVKAYQLLTVLEVARRILKAQAEQVTAIDGPLSAYEHMRWRFQGLRVEKFWVLCLNRKNHLIKCVQCTSGTASASLVHPREVFREAIQCSASAMIAVHNHPSGDPTPSSADVRVTRQLREAAKVIDIPLLDHVIAGTPSPNYPHGFYSFSEAGML